MTTTSLERNLPVRAGWQSGAEQKIRQLQKRWRVIMRLRRIRTCRPVTMFDFDRRRLLDLGITGRRSMRYDWFADLMQAMLAR